MNGTHSMLSPTMTTVTRRPTRTSWASVAAGRSTLKTSKVTSVEAELNVAASDDISAAISAATMKPVSPGGSSRMISVG